MGVESVVVLGGFGGGLSLEAHQAGWMGGCSFRISGSFSSLVSIRPDRDSKGIGDNVIENDEDDSGFGEAGDTAGVLVTNCYALGCEKIERAALWEDGVLGRALRGEEELSWTDAHFMWMGE